MQQAHLWSGPGQNMLSQTVCAVQIQGALETEVFRAGLQQVVEQYEILHTHFSRLPSMDIPVQIISDDTLCSCPKISLVSLDASSRSRQADAFFTALQEEVTDLQHSPLFHLWLLHLEDQRSILLISLPTLCADSRSLTLLVDELSQAYL